MTPTLLPGDLVLARYGGVVRPGSVVLARFRDLPDQFVVKRAVCEESGGWVVSSDNARAGSDSRQHGVADVEASIFWMWQLGSGRAAHGHGGLVGHSGLVGHGGGSVRGFASRLRRNVTRYLPHRVPAEFRPGL